MTLERDAEQVIQESHREERLAEEWLSVKEYAFARKVNVQTVYSSIRRGHFKLPFERIGRTIRINVSRGSIQDRRAS